ncbi:ABC transporter permease subunit [Methylomarinum sp. Ch1-1]|uniref:ABC transporter permease subunit n=1 Tax=Methylomarinum roseum TaxID=3067653 RepID=A0AAU7NWP2_9GAMM
MAEINSNNQASSMGLAGNSVYQKWRLLKDRMVGYGVVAGGLGVIVAIVLIFFYLLYVVFPLFVGAEAKAITEYQVPDRSVGKTLFLAMEEHNEIAVRFTDSGTAVFFRVKSGEIISTQRLPIPEQSAITSFAHGSYDKGVVAYGLSDGRVVVAKQQYKISFPDDKRVITPALEYPLGAAPIVMAENGSAIDLLAIRTGEDESTLVVKTAEGRVLLSHFSREESLFGDEVALERSDSELNIKTEQTDYLLLDKEQRNLYLASRSGYVTSIDVSNKNKPRIENKLDVLESGKEITSLTFLNGEISLLIGDSSGILAQWSMVRDQQNRYSLRKLRAFKVSEQPIVTISPEQRRKGMLVTDREGLVGIYHSTAERELIRERIGQTKPLAVALSPRANAFLMQTADNKIHYWQVKNEHPEVSWASIWQKVWYESYPEPAYIWQSSSASNDFEPKMSLTPLVFGTLKAAFYAMLIAIPLSLMGAVYTAYFMAPRMRQLVKPSIEIMEALPTVILGFLAGLWLAPFVEEHLVGIFALLMVIPLGVMTFAYLWQFAPKSLRHKVPEGWDAALLIPVIVFSAWLAFFISPAIEALCFNGDMRVWMKNEFGIGYDQRNSLVVGLAMGFAVIPTIFSIAEDAIFSVPGHLTNGSLALGATPWQTMTKVVLLTASPGIFSGVMIGLGRAVGETMIVLMATGNTPVMDLSVFQGMRTLSANIAVEMPESAVNSTHYRVLFLAALVLFMFTFVVNTLAEIIRQNLRRKYSSL